VTSTGTDAQFTRRRLRLASGLILFVYLATHLANHAAGLISLDAAEAARLAYVRFWRSLPATSALYAAFVVHIGLAFMALYERHTLRMPVAELLRLALGFSIPFLLVAHFTGTRLAFELYGQDDPYARVVWALWSNDRGLRQLALITIAWAHGCLGLHFLLRHRAFYRAWSHVFFAAAVLVPALGHLGFLAMAAEIDARQAAVLSRLDSAQTASLGQIRDGVLVLFGVLVGGVLAARALRAWRERRRGLTIALRYPGQVVRVPRGWSVLEASRANGIPHLSLCGGRARCSTCRVRVEGAAESLPPPAADEARTLARVGAEAGVRLACQLRPRGDVAVTPLLRPAQPGAGDVGLMSGLERDLVILFIDLRRWTGLAERQFPHDLFYVQELFFEAVGDAVREAGGVPNQFIGDSVMAIFGAEGEPGAHSEKAAEKAAEKIARQALAAARGIEARMAALNERLAREFGHRFGFGIGIHSGPAALGEVGYRDTRTLSAVGDTVNTASRLQELTKQYGVPLVVSERVALAAGLDVAGLEAKELVIRGRANPLRIYALASIAESGA
jgi:adenylate cyclase